MSISKFFFACRTGDIFSRFSDGRGQARSGQGARDTRDGEMLRKRICVSFFFPRISQSRVSRGPRPLRVAFFSIVRAMEIQLFR